MSSISERSRHFLNFVNRVRDEQNVEHNVVKGVQPMSRKDTQKVAHLTRLTKLLGKALSDKEEELKQKQSLSEAVIIEWNQSDDVSQELLASLSGYDSLKQKDDADKLVSSIESFLHTETQLRKGFVLNPSLQDVCVGDHNHVGGNVDSELLLKAQASLRYLEYKRDIEIQLTTALSTLHKTGGANRRQFEESAKNINRPQVLEKIEHSSEEINDLHKKLKDAVAKRLLVEQEISASHQQHLQITHFKQVNDIQRTTLKQLDHQWVRYEAVCAATEKDRKLINSYQNRVTMINNLLTNNAISTRKLRERFSNEAKDNSPTQMEDHVGIDKSDKLLSTVHMLLIEDDTSNYCGSESSISLNNLIEAATNSRISCDRNVDALVDVFLKLQNTVLKIDDNMTTLLNECKRVEGSSNNSAAQIQHRRLNDYKLSVQTIISNMQNKMDTRYVN